MSCHLLLLLPRALLPVPQPVTVLVQLQLQLLLLVVVLERVCMACSCCLRLLACVDFPTFALTGDPPNVGLRSASCGGGLQSQDAHTSHPAHGCCESCGSSEGGRPQLETTSTWCAYDMLLASCASLLSITLCDFSLSFFQSVAEELNLLAEVSALLTLDHPHIVRVSAALSMHMTRYACARCDLRHFPSMLGELVRPVVVA